MNFINSTIVAVGKRIKGLERPHGRSINFSQTITLRCPAIARESRPGQFLMVNCGPDCVLPRPFSIHQVNNKEDIVLYFAQLEEGKGTDWLSRRTVNDRVKIFGPLGNGFHVHPKARNLLLVAGGMGVADLYFLARDKANQGLSVTLLHGTAIRNPYPGQDSSPGITLINITEDGSAGRKGKITDFLPEYVDQADQIFACGPLPMLWYMAKESKKLGIKDKPVQVSLEMRMACGVGVCYGCTIRTKNGLKQVCKDGPVFSLDEIIWDDFLKL